MAVRSRKRLRPVELSTVAHEWSPAKKRRYRLVKLSETYECSASARKSSIISTERSLKMVSGSFYIPKSDVSKPLGDDAHFVFTEHQFIGVADGVGGWARLGVDPGEYARELMANSVWEIQDQPKGVALDPLMVLNTAFLNTEAEGSSTSCILTLTDNMLHAVNVGDSGFLVIRGGEVVYKSPTQQHGFNCPYQLGNSRDTPSSAQELKVPVILGDVVVVGTDGLFYNLHDSDIEELVNRGPDEVLTPRALAYNISMFAHTASMDRYVVSPFTIARREAGFEFMGGKIDDITVVVAYVLPSCSFSRMDGYIYVSVTTVFTLDLVPTVVV